MKVALIMRRCAEDAPSDRVLPERNSRGGFRQCQHSFVSEAVVAESELHHTYSLLTARARPGHRVLRRSQAREHRFLCLQSNCNQATAFSVALFSRRAPVEASAVRASTHLREHEGAVICELRLR